MYLPLPLTRFSPKITFRFKVSSVPLLSSVTLRHTMTSTLHTFHQFQCLCPSSSVNCSPPVPRPLFPPLYLFLLPSLITHISKSQRSTLSMSLGALLHLYDCDDLISEFLPILPFTPKMVLFYVCMCVVVVVFFRNTT